MISRVTNLITSFKFASYKKPNLVTIPKRHSNEISFRNYFCDHFAWQQNNGIKQYCYVTQACINNPYLAEFINSINPQQIFNELFETSLGNYEYKRA